MDEIRQRDGDPYGAWLRAPLDCPPPGAEPLPDVRDRVVTAVERIGAEHGEGDALIIAHGGVISVYACHILGCSFNQLWRLRVDNCSITVVQAAAAGESERHAPPGRRAQSQHFRSDFAASRPAP